MIDVVVVLMFLRVKNDEFMQQPIRMVLMTIFLRCDDSQSLKLSFCCIFGVTK